MSAMVNNDAVISVDGRITVKHWGMAVVVALLLHSILLVVSVPESNEQGAEELGEQGIEVNLKQLLLPSPPKPVTIPKPPVVKPEVAKPVVKPKPVKKVKPKPKPKPKPAPIIKPQEPVVETTTEPVADTAAEPVEPTTEATTTTETAVASPAEASFTGGGDPAIKITYQSRLLLWLEKHRRYPSVARRRGQEGSVTLEFVIDTEGKLLSHRIVKGSSFSSLNRAVEKMIKRANPLPPVPAELHNGQTTFKYTVPVVFKLD